MLNYLSLLCGLQIGLFQSLHRKKKKNPFPSLANVVPLLPPEAPVAHPDSDDDDADDLEAYHAVSSAMAEAESFGDGLSAVTVEADGVLGRACVRLEGPYANLTFVVHCANYPWLVLHLKNQRKFLAVLVVLRDSGGAHRQLTLTNHASVATLDAPNGAECSLPLKLGDGWQLVPVDLQTLCRAVWGTDLASVEQVRVRASCALRKVFLSDRLYADVELPEYLRVLG